MKEVTFLIPYYFSCEKRKDNYKQITEFLLELDTRIITGEMPYLGDGIYLRTKTFNNLARLAKTDIIVLYDGDVFCEPIQFEKAIKLMKEGAKIVRPYDGRFIDVEKMSDRKGKLLHPNSLGGAIFTDRKTFWEVGGENESLIGWGWEDNERIERWHKFGYKLASIPGPLYHLTHPRVYESGPQVKKNRAEYEKIKQMPKSRLKQYVSTWDWTQEVGDIL